MISAGLDKWSKLQSEQQNKIDSKGQKNEKLL